MEGIVRSRALPLNSWPCDSHQSVPCFRREILLALKFAVIDLLKLARKVVDVTE